MELAVVDQSVDLDVAEPEALEAQTGSFRIVEAGLLREGRPTFEQWESMWAQLLFITKNLQWLIGDLIAHGEDLYGESSVQGVDIEVLAGGYDAQTLMNLTWVCRAIPIEERRPSLSFAHHALVASMDRDTRKAVLDRALEEGLTARELRDELSAERLIAAGDPEGAIEPDRARAYVKWSRLRSQLLRFIDQFPKYEGYLRDAIEDIDYVLGVTEQASRGKTRAKIGA